MSVIIRLQNLPLTASSIDIRGFFRGLSIPDGGVHIVGGREGDAFIAFSTDEDARQAMELSGSTLQDLTVRLLLSSRNEMFKVIEQARQTALGILPTTEPPSSNNAQSQNAKTNLLGSQNASSSLGAFGSSGNLASGSGASGLGLGLGMNSSQGHSLDQNHALTNQAHALALQQQRVAQAQNQNMGSVSTAQNSMMQGLGAVHGAGSTSNMPQFPGMNLHMNTPFNMNLAQAQVQAQQQQQQPQQTPYMNPQLLIGGTNSMFPPLSQQQQSTAPPGMIPNANSISASQFRPQHQQNQFQQQQQALSHHQHQQPQQQQHAPTINPFLFPPPSLAAGVSMNNGLNIANMPNPNTVLGAHAVGGGGQSGFLGSGPNPFNVGNGAAPGMGNVNPNLFQDQRNAGVDRKGPASTGPVRRDNGPFQNQNQNQNNLGRRDHEFDGPGQGAGRGGRTRSRFNDVQEDLLVEIQRERRGGGIGGGGPMRADREERGGFGRGGPSRGGLDRDNAGGFGWGKSLPPEIREERAVGVGRGVIRNRDRDDEFGGGPGPSFRGGRGFGFGGRGGRGGGRMLGVERDRTHTPTRDREYNPNNPSLASPAANKDKDMRPRERDRGTRRTKSRSRSRERKRRRSGSRDRDRSDTNKAAGSGTDTRRHRTRSRSRDRSSKTEDSKRSASGTTSRRRSKDHDRDRNTNSQNNSQSGDVKSSSPRSNKTGHSSSNRDNDDDVLIIDTKPPGEPLRDRDHRERHRDRDRSHETRAPPSNHDVDTRNSRGERERDKEREPRDRDHRPRFDAEVRDESRERKARDRDQRTSRFDPLHEGNHANFDGGHRDNRNHDRDREPKRPEGAPSLFDVDVSLDFETSSIIMQNVPINVNERDICDFFSDIGLTPLNVRILSDRAGGAKNGNVICEFQDPSKARRATTKDGMSFGRNTVSVGLLPPSSPNPTGGMMRGPQSFGRGGGRGGGAFGPRASRFPVPGPSGETDNPFVQAMQAVNEGVTRSGPRLRNPLNRGGGGGVSRMGRPSGSRASSGSSTGGFNDSVASVPDDLQTKDLTYFERPGCVVAVTNIPYQATMDDILKYLEDQLHTAVNRDQIIRRFNEQQQPTGDARIAFESIFEAKQAHDRLVGTELWGRSIKVSIPHQF